VLISGPTGAGKTFIASALGNAACRQGFTARYYRLSRLLADLGIAKADGSYPRLLARLAKTDLLLVDEWGLAPLTIADARELLEAIDDRCTTRSTLIASQLPGDAWHGTIPDPSLADALLDRIVHSAHKIALRENRCASCGRRRSRRGGIPMPPCLHEMALRASQRPDSPPRLVAFGRGRFRGPPGGGIRAGESRGILQVLP
jgi:DNA replication protein DnaC